MPYDDPDILHVLRAELAFLDSGGYERNVPRWRAGLFFEDSPHCPNNAAPEHQRPCTECLFTRLVPRQARFARVPCRHISLDATGVTLDDLYRSASYEETKQTVRFWLVNTIAQMETSANAAAMHSDTLARVAKA